MKNVSLLIAIILSLFGGFLGYKRLYEAAAGLFGAAISALAMNQGENASPLQEKNLEKYLSFEHRIEEVNKKNLLFEKENQYLKDNNRELKHNINVLKEKIVNFEAQMKIERLRAEHRQELVSRDMETAMIKAKLEKDEIVRNLLLESQLSQFKSKDTILDSEYVYKGLEKELEE